MTQLMPEDERARTTLRLQNAVVFALEANARVGRVCLGTGAIAVAVSAYWMTWWPLIAALVIWCATYGYVMNSCVRYVQRQLGIPPDVQAIASRLYKTDADFKRAADRLRAAAKARVGHA